METKACEICKHSVRVKYTYKPYSWETTITKSSTLFCIAAPPLPTTTLKFPLRMENVTIGRDKLELYRRYLEVSNVAPCSLFEIISQKKKITEYEKKAARKKKKATEEKKAAEKEKKEKEAEKKKRIAAQKKEATVEREKREKEKAEKAKKIERSKQQRAYRARKKAEKAVAKTKENEFDRFEIIDIE